MRLEVRSGGRSFVGRTERVVPRLEREEQIIRRNFAPAMGLIEHDSGRCNLWQTG